MLTRTSFCVDRTVCAALLLTSVLLHGCGQKGPLYRPDPQAQTVGEDSATNGKKKSTNPPAPQTQKEPTSPAAPPVVDPATPATPPPGH